jgi:hypothetical protein
MICLEKFLRIFASANEERPDVSRGTWRKRIELNSPPGSGDLSGCAAAYSFHVEQFPVVLANFVAGMISSIMAGLNSAR